MSEKNILITGASSGIGNAVANELVKTSTNNLILVARNLEKLNSSLYNTSSANTYKYQSVIADLTDDAQLKRVAEAVIEPLDGVVLAAGELKYKPAGMINRASLSEMFNINFFAPVLLIQSLLKAKKIRKGSSIVFVSSVSANVGVPATLEYASSKAAIESCVRVLAAELAIKTIKVNSVCPGLVKTPMLEKASRDISIDIAASNSANYPLGIGEPTDIAELILFLISGKNNWITGQNIVIDGGYTLNR